MSGYPKPNFTQMPNVLLDEHLPKMSEAELKVVLVIARSTFGWHKRSDKLSLSQLVEKTGMTKQGVLNGIKRGIDRGVIRREECGMSYLYSLVIEGQLVNEVDQFRDSTGQRSRPVVVNEVDQLGPKLVNEVDTQNKDLNKPLNKPQQQRTSSTTSSSSGGLLDQQLDILCRKFESSGFGERNPVMENTVRGFLNEYPVDWIEDALAVSVEANKCQLRYVRGVMKRRSEQGGADRSVGQQTAQAQVMTLRQWCKMTYHCDNLIAIGLPEAAIRGEYEQYKQQFKQTH